MKNTLVCMEQIVFYSCHIVYYGTHPFVVHVLFFALTAMINYFKVMFIEVKWSDRK